MKKFTLFFVAMILNLAIVYSQTNVTTTGGTSGYLPKFNGASTVVNSIAFESSSKIGIGTTSPAGILHLYSASSISSIIERSNGSGLGGSLNFLSSNPPNQADCYIGNINFQAKYSGTTFTGAGIVANSMAAWSSGNYNTRLDFQTNSGNSLSTRMSILDNGNVAIASTDAYGYKLYVNGSGFFTSSNNYALSSQTLSTNTSVSGGYFEGTATGCIGLSGFHTSGSWASQAVGVYGYVGVGVTNGGSTIGVLGESTGTYTSIGVKGVPNDDATNFYGVYGVGGVDGYAGYFAGDVYCTGSYLPSDEKLKDNVKSLESSLDKLMLLKPKSYTYKTSKELSFMNFNSGIQMGFVAQDIEKIFPNLVKKTVQPSEYDKDGKTIYNKVEFSAVNYIGLIPVIVGSIQEQENKIIKYKDQIDSLIIEIEKLKSSISTSSTSNISQNSVTDGAKLLQNIPNPSNGQTEISYNLPQANSQAIITLYDLSGKQIKKYSLSGSGEGKIIINANELIPGMYIYSLIINNQIIDTKRMVITD